MGILNRFKKEKETVGKGSLVKKSTEKKDEAKTESKTKATKKASVKKTTAKKVDKKAVRLTSKKATATILDPIVSEKTAQLADRNILVFRVATDANRIEVRNAFRELYKVTPIKVNMMNVRGKRVRFGRVHGKQQDYKKALITLPKGTRLDIFEGI